MVSTQLSNLENQAMKHEKSSYGQVKAVIGNLVKVWTKLNSTESNIYLFSQLIKRNISTRDVHSFLVKQAKLRKIHTSLDPPMSRAAMKAKLNDAFAHSLRLKQEIVKLKRELLKATGFKRYKQMKIIKQVKSRMNSEKFDLFRENDKKIQRYSDAQKEVLQTEAVFSVPDSIKEFENLIAFRKDGFVDHSNNLLEPPMICDKKIKLSAAEMAILSRGPKFAVRESLVEENFKIELEKMIFKRKYNSKDNDLTELGAAKPTNTLMNKKN